MSVRIEKGEIDALMGRMRSLLELYDGEETDGRTVVFSSEYLEDGTGFLFRKERENPPEIEIRDAFGRLLFQIEARNGNTFAKEGYFVPFDEGLLKNQESYEIIKESLLDMYGAIKVR